MGVEWDLLTTGPKDADRGVLLLPGGGCSASQFAPLMDQPQLAGVRLVAATLPGHAGTEPPTDFSVASYAQLCAQLAVQHRCDVVAGFSMGATVALEMAASGLHTGPVVLLGISLSAEIEPAFFRQIVRMNPRLGGLPIKALMRLTALATRWADAPQEHRERMSAALRRNQALVVGRSMTAYLDYLDQYPSPAQRLCRSGAPAWVVHAQKGDGGLTDAERRALDACATVQVITFPWASFFLPDEKPSDIAGVLVEALGALP